MRLTFAWVSLMMSLVLRLDRLITLACKRSDPARDLELGLHKWQREKTGCYKPAMD